MYERLERLVQLPAMRICAPFLLGGGLMLLALSNDPARALQAGGLVSLLACLVLVREAVRIAPGDADGDDGEALSRVSQHLQSAALHAALFAMSFLLASLGTAYLTGNA